MTELRTKIPNAKSGIDYIQSVGYRRYVIGADLGTLQDPTAIEDAFLFSTASDIYRRLTKSPQHATLSRVCRL
jgi:hypothetical protein